MSDPSRLFVSALVLALAPATLLAEDVRFEINDARVRDKPLAEVRIEAASEQGGAPSARGITDGSGAATLDLVPGVWFISYGRPGYIPVRDSEVEVRGAGQVITTTLSMLLEAEGSGAQRRVRIVLNWGSEPSQVEDADGHAYCVCEKRADAHVYYSDMKHEFGAHTLELDVDDQHWGGPETITLSDPIPGRYSYWVHQYSHDRDSLGQSDIVVRVFFDDRMAAEIKAPLDLEGRVWKPFKAVVVEPDLTMTLERFTPYEIADGNDREPPPDELSVASSGSGSLGCSIAAFVGFALLFGIIVLAKRRRG